MVNTDYCLVLDDFFRILNKVHPKGMEEETGKCKECTMRTRCIFTDKENVINTLLSMDLDQSRFPKTLGMLQNNPQTLYLVPAFVYEKLYGNGHESLDCPYISTEVWENTESIQRVYDLLTTENSKLSFLNILAYRMTLNKDYISRAYSAHPQYFIPEFRNLKSDEIYVDCGAFTGDTIELYCKYNQVPKAAYLFEPDGENLISLKKNLKKFSDKTGFKNIVIVNKGVYKNTGRLYFASGKGSRSHFSETTTANSAYVEVIALDDAINDRVSFIKMDIEGSEYDALLGAKRTIRSYYPKLAICLYHRIDDLWRIPLLIQSLFPEYNHYEIHHHKMRFSETVLYVWRS